jgi:hypothetical protein
MAERARQTDRLKPKLLVPGHGGASNDPIGDLTLTRDYLRYLRQEMGKAVDDLTPFDEAYDNRLEPLRPHARLP